MRAYDGHRDSMGEASRQKSAKGREIGPVPEIADLKRRSSCRDDLLLFCETYNRPAFNLGWSANQRKAIARMQEAIRLKMMFALAMERGAGKTTICRMAALWAISYAHVRYPFVVGATGPKAEQTLDTLRILIRFLPEYAADFPEISFPAQALKGLAQRAAGQTCNGESTLIEWSADRIVLPTVDPPPNWPTWPLRADGKVPTSGVLVSAAGLTGEGLRGSLKTLTSGEMVRPDFVLLDDPQTPESARSRSQNVTRLKLVTADVLGMAGPGKGIAAVMPLTVIERGDMADEVLDRSKHPLWRGERTGILKAMPTNLRRWEEYFEVYARCAQQEPPEFSEANNYYSAHRKELDEGSEASWEDRKQSWETSAIQSAMHLYFRDRRGFMAEYMNRPEADDLESSAALDSEMLAAKVTNVPRCIVPRGFTRLVAFVDVGGASTLHWYMVCAFSESFGGGPIDYGPYPAQSRSYFAAADARPSLRDQFPRQSQEAAIHAGLAAIAEAILLPVYREEETEADLRIERCLIDANWGPGTDLVYDFCRRSKFATLLTPSHGKFFGASSNPMGSWAQKPGERKGPGWKISAPEKGRGRHVIFDTNHWKSFVASRLSTPVGASGCWSLFAGLPDDHRLVADHWTAEYPVKVASRGREIQEWRERPGRPDNHLWDCLVGCAVAASIQGLAWTPVEGGGGKRSKKKLDIEALYAKSNSS